MYHIIKWESINNYTQTLINYLCNRCVHKRELYYKMPVCVFNNGCLNIATY